MPSIYVASLADYNAGNLHGEWIDLDGKTEDEVQAEIDAILRSSKHPNTTIDCPRCGAVQDKPEPDCQECQGTGEVPTAEEWAIHDHNEFCGIGIGEHEEISYLVELAEAIEKHGEPYVLWHKNSNSDVVDTDGFQEAYRGSFRSLEEWAEQWCDDTDMFHNCNDTIKRYFDFESFAEDCERSGDIWSETSGDGMVHVFDNH
jgi:antirestriction protein